MKIIQNNMPKSWIKHGQKIFVFLAMTVLLTTVVFYLYTQPIKITQKAQLDCFYMSYACGDCASQYNIFSADQTTITAFPVIGLDAFLEFKDDALQDRFTNKAGECPRCYQYSLFGQLFRFRHHQDLLLKVDSFNLVAIPGMLEDHIKTMDSLR